MEITAKSLDEIVTEIVDAFDELIAPKRIERTNDNKLYLIFRAAARGVKLLNDMALTLKNRFNPLYCSDEDLYSTAKYVGTDVKRGAGSLLQITVMNPDLEGDHTLDAGTYDYASVSGMVFSFTLSSAYRFAPGEIKTLSAISRLKGSYRVEDNARIKLTRADGAAVDPELLFSCADNQYQLGCPDEDAYAFRSRILEDADRQDHLKELELRIRNLPNIFECNLVFNPGNESAEYDGMTLAPLELLIVITGSPTGELAKLVVEEVCYQTHREDPEKVVYFEHPLYVNGKCPVYYTEHTLFEFSLEVLYQYDEQKLKPAQVENEIMFLLSKYTNANTHIDRVSEGDIYTALANLGLPNAHILNVTLLAGETPAPYLVIPRTRIPRLTSITFGTPENSGGGSGQGGVS
jgi:hypothetical protein